MILVQFEQELDCLQQYMCTGAKLPEVLQKEALGLKATSNITVALRQDHAKSQSDCAHTSDARSVAFHLGWQTAQMALLQPYLRCLATVR